MTKEKVISLFVLFSPSTAFAYIGPGAGLGAIATLVAIVLGMLLLIVGFVWYPLKRALKKKQQQPEEGAGNAPPADNEQQ